MALDLRSIFADFVKGLTLSLNVHQLLGPILAKDRLVGEAFQQLADAIDDIQRTLQKLNIGYVPRIDVTAADGGIVAWLGGKDGKRGAAFNELYAGPSAVEDPDNAEFKVDATGVTIQGTTLVIKQLLIADLSWADDDPGAGSIAWSACTVRFNGTDYSISGDNTALKFVYWDVGDSTFSESNSPTPQQDRFLIATNVSGAADEAWNKVAKFGIQAANVLDHEIGDAKLDRSSDPIQVQDGDLDRSGTPIQIQDGDLDRSSTPIQIQDGDLLRAGGNKIVIANADISGVAWSKVTSVSIVNADINDVDFSKVDNVSIVNADISDVHWNKVTNVSIVNADINDVDFSKVDNVDITDSDIHALTITHSSIANFTITGGKLVNETITDTQIGSLNADKINAGTISADRITGGTIAAGAGGLLISGAGGLQVVSGGSVFGGVLQSNNLVDARGSGIDLAAGNLSVAGVIVLGQDKKFGGIDFNSTSGYKVGGTRVVSSQGAAISGVGESHGTANFGDVNTALDALGVAINRLRSRMSGHGLIA